MKKSLLNNILIGTLAAAVSMVGCTKDNNDPDPGTDPGERWLTVSGALMQDEPGDGNGGTRVYSVSTDDARNPDVAINVFDNGFGVKSQRTARLQSSKDGNFLYNIQYTGADGGVFNKYIVNGGNNFPEADVSIHTANYVGTSPRWAKVDEQTGIAVNVTNIQVINDDNGNYLATRGKATVLAIDLQDVSIRGFKDFEFALSAEDEALGYTIWRLDAPALNKAGNKLYIGTWLRKHIPGTTTQDDASAPRLGTKTIVLDYPSLANPKVITSTVTTGDNSGYRSPMSYAADDGYVYQATHRELPGTGGSHILRIGQDNEYDNDYTFSLDAALSTTDSYIYTWKYTGNGTGIVLYRDGNDVDGVARVDLNARTATKLNIPVQQINFSQYQGITVVGENVYIAVAPVGQDGNIYIINSRSGEVTAGAKLINKPGNQYIGIH